MTTDPNRAWFPGPGILHSSRIDRGKLILITDLPIEMMQGNTCQASWPLDLCYTEEAKAFVQGRNEYYLSEYSPVYVRCK